MIPIGFIGGRVAYEAYCKASGGKSLVSGAPLPAWDALCQEIRDAWDAAADAVIDRYGHA